MDTSTPRTKPALEEVATVAVLEKQQELLRDLHNLLTLYAPMWFSEEMDTRLAADTANFSKPSAGHHLHSDVHGSVSSGSRSIHLSDF
jgi:hypothetical protein